MYTDIYRRWENQKEWENEPHEIDCLCHRCDREYWEIKNGEADDLYIDMKKEGLI